ncbi:hypothetical protein Q8A73_000545 [Channa argus]|nr:hypothetical protein Q8A73_000545 [Channa argus]
MLWSGQRLEALEGQWERLVSQEETNEVFCGNFQNSGNGVQPQKLRGVSERDEKKGIPYPSSPLPRFSHPQHPNGPPDRTQDGHGEANLTNHPRCQAPSDSPHNFLAAKRRGALPQLSHSPVTLA